MYGENEELKPSDELDSHYAFIFVSLPASERALEEVELQNNFFHRKIDEFPLTLLIFLRFFHFLRIQIEFIECFRNLKYYIT